MNNWADAEHSLVLAPAELRLTCEALGYAIDESEDPERFAPLLSLMREFEEPVAPIEIMLDTTRFSAVVDALNFAELDAPDGERFASLANRLLAQLGQAGQDWLASNSLR